MTQELADLLRCARRGCPDATRLLVERYSDLIRQVIRRHLNARMRPALDSIDLLQSVWKDFFAQSLPEHDFDCPQKLYAFLQRMCLNKVHETHRKQLETQKRDRTRQAGLTTDLVDTRQAPPDRVAEASDLWERWLSSHPPKWRKAFRMLGEGYSHREVAHLLGISERTLGRLLARARGSDPRAG